MLKVRKMKDDGFQKEVQEGNAASKRELGKWSI
jgi:hypothetical protein